MASRTNPPTPVADRVAVNIRQVRTRRQLRLEDLAAKLEKAGQRIATSSIGKIEQRSRRVDVDDLVALAVALDTTPNRLLLDAYADHEQIELTPAESVTRLQAWEWATGERLLPKVMDEAPAGHVSTNTAFQRENRPHDEPPNEDVFDDLIENLRPLVQILQAIKEAGLSADTVRASLDVLAPLLHDVDSDTSDGEHDLVRNLISLKRAHRRPASAAVRGDEQ